MLQVKIQLIECYLIMPKIKRFYVILFMFIILLNGCSNSASTNSSLEKPYVALQNSNIVIPLDFATTSNYISFEVVSDFEITKEQITVPSLPVEIYDIELVNLTISDLPMHVYFEYNNVDWNKMYELETGGNELLIEYNAYTDELSNGYDSNTLIDSEDYYYYEVYLSFSEIEDGDEITSIVIENSEGIEIEYDIGYIGFTNFYFEASDIDGFILKTIGSFGRVIYPGSYGSLGEEVISFSVRDEINLTSVTTLNDSINIDKVTVSIISDDYTVNKLLTDEEIIIPANSDVEITISLHDEDFINVLDYATNIHLQLNFVDEDVTASINYSSLVQTKKNFYEIIASYRDKLDFTSYYTDYANK